MLGWPVREGVSLTSSTVMVTVTLSSLALSALPLASLPSVTPTVRRWTDVVSWSRAALVRSWPPVVISNTSEWLTSE